MFYEYKKLNKAIKTLVLPLSIILITDNPTDELIQLLVNKTLDNSESKMTSSIYYHIKYKKSISYKTCSTCYDQEKASGYTKSAL